MFTVYILEVDNGTRRSRRSWRTWYTEPISSCFTLENKFDGFNKGCTFPQPTDLQSHYLWSWFTFGPHWSLWTIKNTPC